MSCPPTNIKFQLRRATYSAWCSTNPVLKAGEPGYDITNNCLKIGDGITPWCNLPYVNSCGSGGGSGTGPTGPIGPTGPAAPALQYDGGYPSISYSYGPVLDCGAIL